VDAERLDDRLPAVHEVTVARLSDANHAADPARCAGSQM
jgi:hypothetical protein